MMYFLDKSRQEKAIAVATRLDKNMRDKNVKVKDTVFKAKKCVGFYVMYT